METKEFYVVYRSNRSGDPWKTNGTAFISEEHAAASAKALLRQEADRTVRVLTPVVEFTSEVVVKERRF